MDNLRPLHSIQSDLLLKEPLKAKILRSGERSEKAASGSNYDDKNFSVADERIWQLNSVCQCNGLDSTTVGV